MRNGGDELVYGPAFEEEQARKQRAATGAMSAMHAAAMRQRPVDTIAPLEMKESNRVEPVKVAVTAEDASAGTEPDRGPAPAVELKTGPEQPEFNWENFQARAEDMAAVIAQHSEKGDHYAGRREAHEAYVVQEDDERLVQFGQLLLEAPLALELLEVKEGLVDKRRDKAGPVLGEDRPKPGLSPEDRKEFKFATRMLCSFNQKLGALVDQTEEHMPPDKLRRWLGEASGDDSWAHSVVMGVQAELSGMKLVQETPGINNAKHGNVKQDLAGKDVVFDETAAGFSYLDVKRRNHHGVMPVEVVEEEYKGSVTKKVYLNIKPEHIEPKGYAVKPEYAPIYRKCLSRVLVEGERLNEATLEVILKEVEAERKMEQQKTAAE